MKEFKEVLKKRMKFVAIYNLLVLILLSNGILHMFVGYNSHKGNYIVGFDVGICIGIELLMLYHLGEYIKALKDESILKKLYISENDERSKYIAEKIGGKAVDIIILALCICAIIFGYINEIVFFTLLATLIFCILVKKILKVYYSRLF